MKKAAKVTIIMPVHNQLALTRKAVEAIYDNTPDCSISWRLLLVDNGSTDGTQVELPRDERMEVIHCQENMGFAGACDQCAWDATSDYLVFIDNTVEVQQGWLEALFDELDSRPETGLVGGRIITSNGKIRQAGLCVAQNLAPHPIHKDRDVNDPLVARRQNVFAVSAACMAARRREFLEIGMFDEKSGEGFEDIDICMRYREAGYNVVYRPDCVAVQNDGSKTRLEKADAGAIKAFQEKWRPVQDDFRYNAVDVRKVVHPLSFAIKIGCPNRNEISWGDIYFAESCAKALCEIGHACQIHYLNEWNREDRDIDVVIHLTGLQPYRTKPWNINLMWMISHPDMHPLEELEKYDAVCIASAPYASHIGSFCRKPVFRLLQAADPAVFAPREAANQDEMLDVVFIGQNGGTGRPPLRTMVEWLLPEDPMRLPTWKCGIYGTGWDGCINPALIRGSCAWKSQADIYRKACLILNDHHGDMAENGFINDRTFNVALCGKPLISDKVRNMEDFIDIPQAGSRKELQELVDYCLNNPREMEEKAARNRAIALEKFTYKSRATEIMAILGQIETPKLRERIEKAK